MFLIIDTEETSKDISTVSKKTESKPRDDAADHMNLSAEARAYHAEKAAQEIFSGDRPVDPLDSASQIEMSIASGAVADAAMRLRPQTHPDFDGETCIECGNDLDVDRLKMGRIYCVPCQTIREKNAKQRGLNAWEIN